jgi:hypothetical protein
MLQLGQKRPPGGSFTGAVATAEIRLTGGAPPPAAGTNSGSAEPHSRQVRIPSGIASPQTLHIGMTVTTH